jgi:general secretion pathway protein N
MTRPALVFSAMLVVALLLLLPLRLALTAAGLDGAGLAARTVSGSLWSGRMTSASWRGVPLGDGRAGLSPLGLVTGNVRLNWRGDTISGVVVHKRGGGGVDGVTGDIGPLKIGGMALQRVGFEAVDIGFDGEQCSRAGGQLTVQPGGALAMAGTMTGTPRCDGDAVVVPLVSADGAAQIELRARANAGYAAKITIEPLAESARAGLLAAGFQPTPQGVMMTVEGVL